MTPLPASLGGLQLVVWRLDQSPFAETWDSGEGAFRAGGRWNGSGVRAIYAALDPATAILEVAVHTGFRALDTVPHTLTAIAISDTTQVHIVQPSDVPNPHWLHPGLPSAGQQQFGAALLAQHPFVVFPSVVSRYSWNMVFTAARAAGAYALWSQERFALDPRLHPPPPKAS